MLSLLEWLSLHQDEYDDHATLSSAATLFLISLVTNRTKSTFLPIVAFINNMLQSYVYFLAFLCSLSGVI